MFSVYTNSFVGGGSCLEASKLGVSNNIALYVHGAGDKSYIWTEIKSRFNVFDSIFREGYSVISPDLGGPQTWGNDSQQSAITAAYNYIKSKTGQEKITIVGQSMGGLGAFIWAKNNPSKVDKLAALIPVINLEDIHSRTDYYRDLINSAYGGLYNDSSMGDQRNPLRIASNGGLDNINMCVWYGLDDDLCKPSFAVDFARSSSCKIIGVPGGHQESTVSRISSQEFREFIRWQ